MTSNPFKVHSTYHLRFSFLSGRKVNVGDQFLALMTAQALNARMRRIDLICKLAGPLFIALIDGASTKIAIFLTLGINVLSIPIEYFAIAQVWIDQSNPSMKSSVTDFSRFTTLSPFFKPQKIYHLPLLRVRLSNQVHQGRHSWFHTGLMPFTISLSSTSSTRLSFRLLRSLYCILRC